MPFEFAAAAVICSIWLSKVWLNWLSPYVTCVGIVTVMYVGYTVPLPKLSDMTFNPWLLEKFGINFITSLLNGVLKVTNMAPTASKPIITTTKTFLFCVPSTTRFKIPLRLEFLIKRLFRPGQKSLSPKAISRAGSSVIDATSRTETPIAIASPNSTKKWNVG